MSEIIYGANTSRPIRNQVKEPEPPAPAAPESAPEKTEEQLRQEHLEHQIQHLQQSDSVSDVRVEGDTVLVAVPVDAIHTLHVDAPQEHQESASEPQQEQ